MNNDSIVISVRNVSKRFIQNEYRPSLRHEALQMFRRWVGLTPQAAWQSKPFWALRDINLTIRRGESVGIIGRNGAGKTTLLRVLSNITDPTHGAVSVKGHFAALIGLGAGFDYERTGYENIYLNAAIYGVKPETTKDLIPAIAEFSELNEFLSRPVKRYSSGMLARLGFSIAIHIIPDIIFLDEVLAVGDSAFQQKCLDQMHKLKERECTILFVSHVPDAIRMLCERSIWLHEGRVVMDGLTEGVIQAYEDRF